MSGNIVITRNTNYEMEEWYGKIYQCPACVPSDEYSRYRVWGTFKFCPDCGAKIDWIGDNGNT